MSLYDSMRHDVEEFVDLNFGKCSENVSSHFAATLTQEFDAVLGTLNAHTDEPHLRDALRALKKLQEHLVILPVDKTSHDFGFICKEKYKELVRNELQQSSTYQQLDSSVESILQQHQAFNKSHNFPHSNILPYLYGIPKLHKPQPRMRYIAGVSEKGNAEKKDEQKVQDERRAHKKQPKTRASTTPAHQEASGILKLVLATLQGKDEVSRAKTGIRRFFVVESIDGVAVHIKTNYARLRKKTPRTFDFKEMYTKIPQQRIVDYVMLAVLEAFEYAKSEKGFDLKAQRSKHRFEFSNAEAADMTAYSVEEIRELVEFIVGNTFVTNGGRCYQQVTGIPMGGNASPDLANLYCYWCEKLYIDSLIAEGRHEEARAHADSVRFIDDFLTWGVRPPPEAIYGMEYSETSKGVDDVVFLGMRIRAERDIKTDYIRLSVLDKGEEFPWYPIKYTHAESTVPRNTGTSIFKGALIRAARICNNMPDLKVEIMKVYYRLRNRGFSGRELRHVFDTFVTQTYGKYELDARVLSRFYYYVGKAYDEGRPTNVEKRFIGIRAPQQPAAPPESPSPPKSVPPHDPKSFTTTAPIATNPPDPHARGINNIRNSCFFAASVQFLARKPSFRTQLAALQHPNEEQLIVRKLFTDFDAGRDIHSSMATIRSLVFDTTDDDSQHRDAHELLTWIRSCVRGDDDDPTTVTYTRLTTCFECGGSNTAAPALEPFLLVELKNREKAYTEPLEVLVRKVKNKKATRIPDVDCDTCHRRTEGSTKELYVFPSVMDVALKRAQRSKRTGEEIKLKVRTPIQPAITIGEDTYRVTGFIVHTGKVQAGHYYTVLRENDVWVCYDDQQVSLLSWEECAVKFTTNGYIVSLERA
ncbi:Ubiquitin carboxyl-terminal hydrolase 26 [Diplonema papillatum]|nr:Ubiquitin carboxyl-terminal hydrolase 26 [Diplonema papillatum]